MTEIFTAPIFPTGVVAIAEADRKYSEDFNKNNFEFDDKWDIITKQRSNKFESVLDHPSLSDMKTWIVKTASQFLKDTIIETAFLVVYIISELERDILNLSFIECILQINIHILV